MFNNFFQKSYAVCEIMWKTAVEPELTVDNITQHMLFACLITKATNTQSECNTYCFSTATVVR